MDPGGVGLVHPGRELHRLPTQLVPQDLGEALPHHGAVAVPGQVDQGGDVARVGVATHEGAQLPALTDVHHALRDGRQLGRGGVEELVPRIVLQRVHQRLAGVAAVVEPDRGEHRRRLLPQQRDPGDGLGVGATGQQPQEAALAGHVAVLVEGLHPDVVQVGRAVHGGSGVGLGQDQQGALGRLLPHHRPQPARGAGHVRVRAQDAQPGAGHRPQREVVPGGLERVLAVAEEGEVVVGKPFQKLAALADLRCGQVRGCGAQLRHDRGDLGAHLLPVLDRLAHVAKHPFEGLGQPRRLLGIGDPVDLHVHPGLRRSLLEVLVGGGLVQRRERHHLPAEVPAHGEPRVDDPAHLATLPGQLHGDRVDQEGHVVGDDLDHRVTARGPAVALGSGSEDPDHRPALGPDPRGPVVAEEGAEEVNGRALEQVLRRRVPVVGREQDLHVACGEDAVDVLAAAAGHGLPQEVELLFISGCGHGLDPRTRGVTHTTRAATGASQRAVMMSP